LLETLALKFIVELRRTVLF